MMKIYNIASKVEQSWHRSALAFLRLIYILAAGLVTFEHNLL
jgi:hypothetical protein